MQIDANGHLVRHMAYGAELPYLQREIDVGFIGVGQIANCAQAHVMPT